MKKKIAAASLIAILMTGCGLVATTGTDLTTSNSTATQSALMSLMGLEGSTIADPASGSVGVDRGNLLFTLLDTDGDGSITPEEFSGALAARKATLTEEQLKAMFDLLDRNSDGAIALEEIQPPKREGNMGCQMPPEKEGGRKRPGARHRGFDGHPQPSASIQP
ncbi:MAG TPA: hypothetical protein DD435_15440 [Cyanobacteria bacterium UBA8530]|nr:hypothetical protein [Cyanobacteria bacterium UBA8530]